MPRDFRFSVKVPKQITHELRLVNCAQPLEEFIGQCSELGQKLGCILLQLPPSLDFDETVTEGFLKALKEQYSGPVILEPRHESWANATSLLKKYQIAQAAVDPSRLSVDSSPQGAIGVQYWRLHGSPRIYHSPYDLSYLERLATKLLISAADGTKVWCIFDNTASGAALRNALDLSALISKETDSEIRPTDKR